MKNSAFNSDLDLDSDSDSDRNRDIVLYMNINPKMDFLAAYKPKSKKPTKITGDMSSEEIVEFVTDRLMENINAQFAETKRRYLAEKAEKEK